MASRPGLIRRFFGGLMWLLDATRRLVLNLLFLAVIVVLAIAWFASGRAPTLEPKTALILNLSGDLVDQYTTSGYSSLLASRFGERQSETRVRDVLDALRHAASDPNVDRVVLLLDDLSGGGTPSLREVAAGLQEFRKSGKQVVAWGSRYTQRQYFLAAHADEVYLHPFGEVLLRGFGGSGLYFRDALDKLGVTVHGFQAGRYKSVVEPFTRNAPSADALEADRTWLVDAWTSWRLEVEQARRLPEGQLTQGIDQLPQRLAAAGGDAGKLALAEGLVDALKTRDEFRALMIERGAPINDKRGTFRQANLQEYLGHVGHRGGDGVGVVVAQGEIVDDDFAPNLVGGRQTAELIRRAREDERVKALVLRIDSPGGTAFGSEIIRREVELTRKAGKPVIASMGDVAASGGYWIASAADAIVADPTTITGSIGVAAMVPSFDRALDKLSIGAGGVSTTWLAAATDPTKPLDPRVAALLDGRIQSIYQRFLQVAGEGRRLPVEKVHAVAQGRVWTGRQARDHGLVDQLGGLQDAVRLAAERAKLDADAVRPLYFERDERAIDRVFSSIFGTMVGVAGEFGIDLRPAGFGSSLLPAPLAQAEREAQRALRLLTSQGVDPLRAYAHCLCEAP